MGRSISAINIKTRDVTRIEWYIKGCGSLAQSLCIQTTARKVRDSCVARGSENTWNLPSNIHV